MFRRDFNALVAPHAIALIGASDRPGSVGQVVAANLLAGGFAGEIGLVDAGGRAVQGRSVVRRVADLGMSPDLAVIATPAASVPSLISELGEKGCQAAIVLSAGFEGDSAEPLRRDLLNAARAAGVRIVGPNCLGLISTAHGVNASFVRGRPLEGPIGLIAQSGAVAAAAMDWAPARGLGFSHVITLGDALDLDMGDMLDLLARDSSTRAILLYVESIRDARKFMSAARLAASAKPVVVLKGGRSASGASAAFSHTRALAGASLAYSAAFRRAGILEVGSLEDLFAAGLMFRRGWPRQGERLAILTNGGGAGVLAADALDRVEARLAPLSDATREALQAGLPAMAACRNPVDILGDADPGRYGRSLATLLAAPEVDAVLAINCPTAVADSAAAAKAVIEAHEADRSGKPVIGAWLGEIHVAEARARLDVARVPSFETPEAAVRAFGLLSAMRRGHDLLGETPDEGPTPPGRARALLQAVRDAGRTSLAPLETQALLAAYGVPIAPTLEVSTPSQAARAAAGLGGEIVLKIRSPDLTHKSDVGGVQLGLKGAAATYRAAREMRARLGALRPDVRLDGFVVQPMIRRPKAEELLVGMIRDPLFGPLVAVAHGGVATEVRADRALGLPPLNRRLARDMIGQTRVARLLAGYRDRPPADLDALADLIVAIGRLAMDAPEIAELDLNPVLSDGEGVVVLDARVRIDVAAIPVEPAILPYPLRLIRSFSVEGQALSLRPIRPSDANGLVAMIDRSDRQDVRSRFGGGLRHLAPDLARRLSQVDYDRQMAFVAEASTGELVGVGRLVADPPGETAEFALMVRSDHQRHGLGHELLVMLLEHAQRTGLKQVWGDIGRDNDAMIEVAADLGFVAEKPAVDDDLARTVMVKSIDGLPVDIRQGACGAAGQAQATGALP